MYIHYLRVWGLCEDIGHCVGVASERVYAGFGPHVPDAGSGVPTSSEENVDGGVERDAVDTTEVAMVVADNLTHHIISHTSHHTHTHTNTHTHMKSTVTRA